MTNSRRNFPRHNTNLSQFVIGKKFERWGGKRRSIWRRNGDGELRRESTRDERAQKKIRTGRQITHPAGSSGQIRSVITRKNIISLIDRRQSERTELEGSPRGYQSRSRILRVDLFRPSSSAFPSSPQAFLTAKAIQRGTRFFSAAVPPLFCRFCSSSCQWAGTEQSDAPPILAGK